MFIRYIQKFHLVATYILNFHFSETLIVDMMDRLSKMLNYHFGIRTTPWINFFSK